MYINAAKILKNRTPNDVTITENFKKLKSNDTYENRWKFNNYFSRLPDKIALEHINCLYEMMGGYDTSTKKEVDECGNVTIVNNGNIIINQQIEDVDNTDMIIGLMSRYNMSGEDIQEHKDKLDKYIYKLKNTPNVNKDNLDNLKNISGVMERLIEERNSNEYLREDTIHRLSTERFTGEDYNSTASYLANDINVVTNNINQNPECLSFYERTIRNMITDRSKDVLVQLPYVLKANSDLVLNVKVTSIGQSTIKMICSVPESIVNKIIKMGLNRSQYTAYIKILDMEISRIYSGVIKGDPRQYQLYMQYLDGLKYAKSILVKYTEKYNLLNENIACMQPNIYDECVLEDVAAELEEYVANMVFDEDMNDEAFENFSKLCYTYETLYHKIYGDSEAVEEAGKIASASMRASHTTNRMVRKKVHNMQRRRSVLDRIKAPIRKIGDPIVNFIANNVEKIKKMDKEQRRKRIIDGTLRSRIYTLFRRAVGILGKATIGGLAGGIIFGPVGGIIGSGIIGLLAFITSVAREANLDDKERKKILHELETELKIVDEKIDDAKGDGNKEAKYQLIRIKTALEKDIERIKFRLKD